MQGVIFRQLIHDDLGCASYLIGDEHAGVAAVVDPRLEIDEYLALARYMGVRIEHILETHNHADHVSGHGRLEAATGAAIHIHREAAPQYAHEPFDDGWELELGCLRVRALHTPGHRPEHTSFALIDTRRSDEPWAVLTGDTLFVGDIARPDLAIEKSEGARGIFRSLRDSLLALPDTCEVWPGHLGGSMCGGPGMDMKISSTIGYERDNNAALRIEREEDFVAHALARLGPQPPNLQAIVALNTGPLRSGTVDLPALSPRQVQQQREDGALVVDVRTDLQFDEAHIPGSVCIPMLRAGFGSKLAWIAGGDRQIVLVGRDDEDGRRAAALAVAVGVRSLAGCLAGGMTSWRQERHETERTERLSAAELAELLLAGEAPQILDVRERLEWEAGHVPGSVFEPWHDITKLPAGLDPERPIAVVCASGQRAATGASMLRRQGASAVLHVVDGGVPALERLGVALEAGAPG
ncbi:MAG: hydroxyacylglutathione hydrolase [Solirubrobacteraceae bacterium]|nr:hydroxyacylglutathione hydrolase [Solirubrobacteraceae bacterium]